MSILVDKHTVALIQGITGHEGSRAASEMLHYNTPVIAGVTPGKGGQKTEHGIPVYNSVEEALRRHPTINASLIAVPPRFAADAAMEAIWNSIPLVNILTEKIPVADVSRIIALGRQQGVQVIGPSSVGIISPTQAKIGAIGASELVNRVFKKGSVGVISKSGGMTAEISRIITEAGLGQSTAIGIGGDVLLGTTFLDCARLFEKDKQTKAIVIFGEVGGSYEEELADAIAAKEITKPVIALIAGDFSHSLPQGTVLGHAGAIVSQGKGSAKSKIRSLKKAGALIATTPENIPVLLKKVL
ncbi:MAG: succinate--CoA ligase subunit alpha [Candidatus Andersenbacteria bacterium]